MDLSKTEFAGDVLLSGTDGIGNIVIEDGLVKDCRNFSTAVYLSLFGGNARDSAGRENETWWGNLIPGTKKNEKLVSSFFSKRRNLQNRIVHADKAVCFGSNESTGNMGGFFTLKVCRTMNHKRLYGTVII